MIKLEELTPLIYYKESRDFQLIGRLFDLVLNFCKTSADTIYYLPQSLNADKQFVTLLAMTLGFKPKHNYNSTQLRAICSILPTILKNKGSLNAILLIATTLLRAEGIVESLEYDYLTKKLSDDDDRPLGLTIYLPIQLHDTILLEDLLDYVAPAGLNITIVKELRIRTDATTKLAVNNYAEVIKVVGNNVSRLIRDFDDKEKALLADNTEAIAHATLLIKPEPGSGSNSSTDQESSH